MTISLKLQALTAKAAKFYIFFPIQYLINKINSAKCNGILKQFFIHKGDRVARQSQEIKIQRSVEKNQQLILEKGIFKNLIVMQEKMDGTLQLRFRQLLMDHQRALDTLCPLQHNMYNSQWSLIHKSIPSKYWKVLLRNKVKIRNRFYGTLRNFIRFLLQHFQQAPGTITIVSNKIKPIVLQKLYSSQQQFQFVGETLRNLISTMNYSIDKQKLAQEVNKDQQFYLKILNAILKKKSKLRVKQKLPVMKENPQFNASSKIYKNSPEWQNNQKSPSMFFRSAEVPTNFNQIIGPITQEPLINFSSEFLPRLMCSPQIIVWPSDQQFRWKYPVYFQI